MWSDAFGGWAVISWVKLFTQRENAKEREKEVRDISKYEECNVLLEVVLSQTSAGRNNKDETIQ